MAKGKAKKSEPKRVGGSVEQLPVHLTDTELLDFGHRLAEQHQKAQDHESHAKAVKDQLKAQEAAIISERYRLSQIVRTKQETRDVKVSCWHDYAEGRVRFVRDDTGEVTHERPMNNDERQTTLAGLSEAGLKAVRDMANETGVDAYVKPAAEEPEPEDDPSLEDEEVNDDETTEEDGAA